MKALLPLLLLAACAMPTTKAPPPLGPHEIRSAQAALQALTPGNSTKAEVRALLGEAVAVDFDSGYEVWVYHEPLREKDPQPARELVLLFDPSGILAKLRVRQEIGL